VTNPKGTQAETAFVRYARENGFGGADRLTKTGASDRGDVALCPGVMAELKNTKTVKDGGPAPGQLRTWMLQTRLERIHGDWSLGFLVVKRTGTTDVGRWFAFIDAVDLALLVVGSFIGVTTEEARRMPVCLPVRDLLRLLRASGWGDPL
jgi:hypothetical protein